MRSKLPHPLLWQRSISVHRILARILALVLLFTFCHCRKDALDYDLMYVEACYEQALEDEADAAAFDAYYEQAIEDADAEIAAQVVVRRAANLPVVSLVDLKPEAITDEQLAEARRYLYTSTEGLAVGMTKLVTAKRLEQPEIATWMTLDEGEDRQKSKEELRAYKAALAKRSERKVEQGKVKRQQEIDARAQICDASWLR